VSNADITRVKALGFLLNKGTNSFNGRVITRNGRITAREAAKVAQAAQLFGDGHVEMTSRMTLEVSGIPYEKIEDFRAFLAQEGLETGGTGSKVRPVVSCKGTTCHYGLIDTFGLSDEIHRRFYKGYRGVKLPHKFKIAVGGCPNNCVKPDLNDLGVIGQRVPKIEKEKCKGCKVCQVEKACPLHDAKVAEENGKRIITIDTEMCNHCGRCVGKCPFGAVEAGLEGYRIYLGGRWGKKTAVGQSLDTIFTTPQQVLDVIEKAILLFRRDGISGERFADTINRLGFENVQKTLMSDELTEQKSEILKDENSPEGGATC
jgi:dissimilatory sulfite reductase (desulfoviridin) alpha/beta subunit